jgi:hypothetical protein
MRAALLALLAGATLTGSASAHALGAECKLRDGRLVLEAYFDDDTAARDAVVRLLDAEDNVVAQGRTDDEGRWSCSAPEPGRYRVVVDAGAGHLAQLRLTIPKADPPAESAISEGPSRREFTRFPWLNVSLGLVILASIALLGRTLSRRRSRAGRAALPPSPPDLPIEPGGSPGRAVR